MFTKLDKDVQKRELKRVTLHDNVGIIMIKNLDKRGTIASFKTQYPNHKFNLEAVIY